MSCSYIFMSSHYQFHSLIHSPKELRQTPCSSPVEMADRVTVSWPAGYRFDPDDEVLVEAYLMKKVFSQPLPIEMIPEHDVFQSEPWVLPKGDEKYYTANQYYFFNTRGRDLESLDRRVAGSGQWRMLEKGKDIPIPDNNQVIGKRNTLTFWDAQGRMTKWVMHEFRLVVTTHPARMATLAAYRIFEKKEAKKARRNARNPGRGGRNSARAEVIDVVNADSGDLSGPPPATPTISEGSGESA